MRGNTGIDRSAVKRRLELVYLIIFKVIKHGVCLRQFSSNYFVALLKYRKIILFDLLDYYNVFLNCDALRYLNRKNSRVIDK